MASEDLEAVDAFEMRRIVRPLSTCWALANHWDHDENRRTRLGSLVNEAKTYLNKPGNPATARSLAAIMARTCAELIQLGRMALPDIVVPVPANPPKEPHNLPDVLGAAVAEQIGAVYDPNALRKLHTTPFAKTSTLEEIKGQLDGAYVLGREVLGQTVMVVDDLVRTGGTLSVIGILLQASGALPMSFGVVATRATAGMKT